uniref:Uncharacterized protein n=1 Tax=Oryza nivara TaxID=4536 RepID=A0A0E0JC46_ORYNI
MGFSTLKVRFMGHTHMVTFMQSSKQVSFILAGLLQDAHNLCPFNSMQCAVCACNFHIHVVPSCVLFLACKNVMANHIHHACKLS